MNGTEWSLDQARKLVGGTITDVFIDPSKEFWGIKVHKDGKVYAAWVLCDPEGNGAGHLDIGEWKN